MSNFDDIIDQIGGVGRYQATLILMFFCLVFPTSYNTLLPLFILTTPKHRCAIPGMDNDTYAVQSLHHQQLIDYWIPREKKGDEIVMSSCKLFKHSLLSSYGNRSEESCDRWVFDKEYFDRTLIEELSIVCDQKELRSHANSAMMVGKFVSALAEGIISDNFGRRCSLLIFIIIMITSSFINAFTFNIPSLLAFRFLAGLGTTSTYMSAYVVTLEFISPKHRQKFNVFASFSWLAGAYALTLFAYFIRDYKTLCLVTAGPSVILLSYFWILPESARWLMLRGRVKEARTILENIARTNKRDFPEDTFDQFVDHLQAGTAKINEETGTEPDQHVDNHRVYIVDSKKADNEIRLPNENVCVLMKHRSLAIRLIIVFWNWCANSLTYYGILFNVQNLIGSIYLNFTITNTVDLVVNLVALYVVDRFGRKKTYVFSFFLSAFACLAVIAPSEVASTYEQNVSVAVLSMVGRAGVSAAFNIMYLYSSEMFPTTTRGSVLGMSSMCSRVGSVAAPYVADLGILVGGKFQTTLPLIVFGGVGFLASVSGLFLPETLGVKLPNTVEDALEIGRNLQ